MSEVTETEAGSVTPAADPETPSSLGATLSRDRPRRVVVFPLLAALTLFFGPGVAYLLGDRAEAVENRDLAEFPSLDLGWDFLPAFGAWAIDHLPLRSEAVLARTRISEAVFGELPRYATAPSGVGVAGVGTGTGDSSEGSGNDIAYPQVIEGRDGWLFYGVDVSAACKPAMQVPEITRNLQRLAEAATASNRRLLITIAPDKSSAHPELLPETFAGEACMEKQRAQFWASISALPNVDVLDPRSALASFESESGASVWRPNDTHWGPAGAAVFSKAVAEAIEPRTADGSRIAVGPSDNLPGDLSQMLGDLKSDSVPTARVEREGVTLRLEGDVITPEDVPDLGYGPITVTASSTGAPLIPGKTLLLGDSFFAASRFQFPIYYSSLTYIHSMSAEVPGATDAVAALLAESDTLIFEMVERSAVGGHVAFLGDQSIEALVTAMEENPRG